MFACGLSSLASCLRGRKLSWCRWKPLTSILVANCDLFVVYGIYSVLMYFDMAMIGTSLINVNT
jgi:hypothetical protein